MGTCRECKWCIGKVDDFYMCGFMNELELVEDIIAEDEEMGCDLYEQDLDVDD